MSNNTEVIVKLHKKKKSEWIESVDKVVNFIDTKSNFICIENGIKAHPEQSDISIAKNGKFVFIGTFEDLISKLQA